MLLLLPLPGSIGLQPSTRTSLLVIELPFASLVPGSSRGVIVSIGGRGQRADARATRCGRIRTTRGPTTTTTATGRSRSTREVDRGVRGRTD
ncbi:hypothetical protein BDV38DRAFT_254806 [Aspergillus pseudotamarii]|uniref:Uncharacterized protein n=1 Tax=Aspergillus pseudotamarii TaxID=132259 RepID=A0A5N6SIS7_ASPPS|nr:uncharacterized protein BDV38DRAFT_254806 [Aspergillus pseudotamarii]KAE8134608.1 hypothetical protein BDV38DRAFT_254806 [Aspergillus pseudotamarii]